MADAPPIGAPLPLRAEAARAADVDALRRAAEEFEAVFLAEMLAPMFEALETDGLGGGGVGEQIFRPMLVERYAEALAAAGGVGVAESVLRELMRLQETVQPESSDGADR
jgi:Rod binding domain-containing protein